MWLKKLVTEGGPPHAASAGPRNGKTMRPPSERLRAFTQLGRHTLLTHRFCVMKKCLWLFKTSSELVRKIVPL